MYDLRLRAERLQVTGGFDRLVCLDDISVDHYQHQLDAARRALAEMHGRTLLADEVGLGKTIEAGIVMKEMIERGLAASILIVVPAALTWQWREEMQTKFHEEFVVLEAPEQFSPETGAGRWIISLDRARSNSWAERLLAQEYDLLIVDEAHKLKNHRTQAYRLIDGLRKRYVLMLTATPVHNDLLELYNLVNLLRPGHLGTRQAFRQNFVGGGSRRRIVTWSNNVPNGITSYVNSTAPGRLDSYHGFSARAISDDFDIRALVPPPLLSGKKNWARQIQPEDLAEFGRAREQLISLLQQGYQVGQGWLVQHKKGGIYGFRIELFEPGREDEQVSPVPPETAKKRPSRRTVYSSHTPPGGYLQKSDQARLAYREDPVRSSWILKRTDKFDDLAGLSLEPRDQPAVAEIQQLLAQGYEVVDFEAVEYMQRTFLKKRLRVDFVCRFKLNSQLRAPAQRSSRTRRTTPRNPQALRRLLQEVMIRHRRHNIGIQFPRRRAAVDHLNLAPPERELYDGVTAFIRTQLRQAEAGPGSLKMTLLTLQKELCSSPQAAAQTLEKMLARQPDPELARYLTLAQSIPYGRKVDAARLVLDQYPGKFLIFTEYLPTLHALRAALEEVGHHVVVFYGGMTAYEQVEAIRAFRGPARVMISSRSGAEGHNLQFCHQMINYDLPWNPMRIEQRIGRLQRLGQKQEVLVFNLSATATIEAYILELLAKKIRMFELVIGELDLILGALDEERSFEDYLEAAWATSYSEAELLHMLAELEKLLGRARITYEDIHDASDQLSDLIDAFDEVLC
jgi:superfamily II DNA or RNA helicase